MNREFTEEMGSAVGFEDTDLAFISAVEGPVGRVTLTYIFCKRTSDEAFFNSILAAFYTTPRKAYINEVYAVMGLPIFTEGPAVIESGTGKSIYGLPRYLIMRGGSLTSAFTELHVPREQLLLLLAQQRVLTMEELAHLFDCCAELYQHYRDAAGAGNAIAMRTVQCLVPLPWTLQQFCALAGVRDVLQKSSV